MTTPSAIKSLFKYKAWANKELFAALQAIDAVRYANEFQNALRILNHIHVVDRIFKAHLLRLPHAFKATNTQDTPSLAALAAAVAEVDAWFVEYGGTLDSAALAEVIKFTFTDGDLGAMSREEILVHVTTHGGYHRGAVGQLLRSMGAVPPRDLYTRFLHDAEPKRRASP